MAGFHFEGREDYENLVTFSVETLVDYLVTQSNVIAAVEGGHQSVEDVRQWIADRATSFFGNQIQATFLFRGPIWYLKRIG